MKRILFLIAVIMLSSCSDKGNEKKTEASTNKAADVEVGCMSILRLPSYPDALDEAAWLKEHTDVLCEGELFKVVQGTHKIPETNISDRKIPYEIKWSDIKGLIKQYSNYQKYIFFSRDSANNIIGLEIRDEFTQDETCYSVALFRSIEVINDLSGGEMFVFQDAKVDGNDTVVFNVINNNSNTLSHYDFSDYPKFRKDKTYRKSPL